MAFVGELSLHSNFKSIMPVDRCSVYRSHLMEYGCEIIASICAKRSKQWTLLSYLEPGMVLFTFHDHQRICFSKRPDRIAHKFRTSLSSRRLSHYSFRVLWIVQSPVFQEVLLKTLQPIDYGKIYLTFTEDTNTFAIRVSWDTSLVLMPNESLVQIIGSWGDDTTSVGVTNISESKEEIVYNECKDLPVPAL